MRIIVDARKSRSYLSSYHTSNENGTIWSAAEDNHISLVYKCGALNIPYCTADDESEEGLNQWQEQALKSAEWGTLRIEHYIEGKPTFDIIAKGYPSLHAYSVVLFNNGVIDIGLRRRK